MHVTDNLGNAHINANICQFNKPFPFIITCSPEISIENSTHGGWVGMRKEVRGKHSLGGHLRYRTNLIERPLMMVCKACVISA